ITPTSSYASGDAPTATTNETSVGTLSEANRATGATPVARSFRATAATVTDGSSRRGAASPNAPRAQTDMPATTGTAQPRSTRVAVVAP
ncbi:MAG: hypothetical protein LC742_09325, partial [Acidobacteria bacterium]|nr:hypothetical protein [Acidobacteriota bacterium]